jgi:TPR repeat protein
MTPSRRPLLSLVVRTVVLVAAIATCPAITRAGPCDLNWDGEALARNVQGRNPAFQMRLLDTNKNVYAELTGAQILAISEAKDGISKQLGRQPSLAFCSDKAPNAFAMKTPNGEVVAVTLGLAKLINGDRDMAAFVIGHEYAHLVLGHLAAAQQRRALLNLLGELAGAVLEYKTQTKTHVQGVGMDVGILGASLISYKFDRDQEREADKAGFKYMVDAGFSPLGAVRLSETMQRYGAGGIGLFFDNHPGWPERAERFQALIKASPMAQATIARVGARTTLTTAATGAGQTQVALAPVYKASDAERAYADGLAALGKQDYPTALTAIRSSVAAGYAPAQTALGYLYSEGQAGLPNDEVEALRLYRLAVAQSNAYAMNNLGSMYMGGHGGLSKDEVEAVRLYREAANQGNALALSNLGVVYLHGLAGIEKDENAARIYFQRASDAGNGDAMAALGAFYYYGQGGIAKNIPKAFALYRQAADKGSAAGLYAVAQCYELGVCEIQKDEVEAVKWFQMAANQGSADAQNDLGSMYYLGAGGLPKSATKAAELYKLSANSGNPRAQANLGTMYRYGEGGLGAKAAEAVRLFQLSASQGNSQGEYDLGAMYESGEGGLPQDKERAVSWYQKSAAQVYAMAATRLNHLHVN